MTRVIARCVCGPPEAQWKWQTAPWRMLSQGLCAPGVSNGSDHPLVASHSRRTRHHFTSQIIVRGAFALVKWLLPRVITAGIARPKGHSLAFQGIKYKIMEDQKCPRLERAIERSGERAGEAKGFWQSGSSHGGGERPAEKKTAMIRGQPFCRDARPKDGHRHQRPGWPDHRPTGRACFFHVNSLFIRVHRAGPGDAHLFH